MTNSQAFSLPTVFPSNSMGMDFLPGPTPNNHNEVRGRNLSTNRSVSRDLLMSSTKSSVAYYEMMVNNGMDVNKELVELAPALSYETEQKRAICTNKAAEQQENMRQKGRNLKAPNSNPKRVPNVDQRDLPTHGTVSQTEDDIVINIQLLYDPQAPTKPDLWSGNFHPISLHGSIEQIASDVKNIKDSLNFMARYISNKKINPSKTNELEDFNGMSDFIWNFISLVYQANWDSLHTDNQAMTLRAKISSKFTPKITLNPGKNNKEIAKHVLVTIEKIPLLPPLLAKSKKEVNVILKYFQSNKPSAEPKKLTMLYAQASKQTANASEVLKIKEAFPVLNVKKIDQISNIVKGNPKLKPRIQMTTKGPSRKQVIVPMSSENNNIFMKNSATHVVNINRLLRNTKSEVLVDYICSDPLGISVITNKVLLQSDLQIIDQYVKNSEDINALQVDKPCLPQLKSYLKTIGILYFSHGNSQDCLTFSDMKMILKQNQIFDNINSASKPRVIKVLPKSDMSII